MSRIEPVKLVFPDVDGQALENGSIYVGTAGLDPIANQVTVYWDQALTQPAAQPIRTKGGYPVNSGVISAIYTGLADYSIAILDKNNVVVQRDLNAGRDLQLDYVSPGNGAVQRTIASKLSDFVSVKDFGATGDGSTDDSAAIQAAINFANGGKKVFFPLGTYNCTNINLVSGTTLIGETYKGGKSGTSGARLYGTNGANPILNAGVARLEIRNLTFDGAATAGIESTSSYLADAIIDGCNFTTLLDYGINAILIASVVENCTFGYLGGTSGFTAINVLGTNSPLQQANDNVFRWNRIYNSDTGGALVLDFCANARIEGNIFQTNDVTPIVLNGLNSVMITSNFFEQNAASQLIKISDSTVNSGVTTEATIIGNYFDLNNLAVSDIINTNMEFSFIGNKVLGSSSLGSFDLCNNSLFVTFASGNRYQASNINEEIGSHLVPRIGGMDCTKETSGTAPNAILKSGKSSTDNKIGVNNSQRATAGTIQGGFEIQNGTEGFCGIRGRVVLNNAGDYGLRFYTTESDVVTERWDILHNGNLSPVTDNSYNIGSGSLRVNEIFAAVGTINTSDDRDKTYLSVEQVEKDVALEIKGLLKKFKFNDAIDLKGESEARIHFGASAQTIKSVFENHGLNPNNYALFCYDEWYELSGEIVPEGTEGATKKYRYGIRYSELAMFILMSI